MKEKLSMLDILETLVDLLKWYAKRHGVKTNTGEAFEFVLAFLQRLVEFGLIKKWKFWLTEVEARNIVGNTVNAFRIWKDIQQKRDEMVEEINIYFTKED